MDSLTELKNLTYNDYKILQKIISDKKGISKLTGRTKNEIIELTGLSRTKVNTSIWELEKLGLIEEGIMKVRAKTYYITPKGSELLKEMKKKVI